MFNEPTVNPLVSIDLYNHDDTGWDKDTGCRTSPISDVIFRFANTIFFKNHTFRSRPNHKHFKKANNKVNRAHRTRSLLLFLKFERRSLIHSSGLVQDFVFSHIVRDYGYRRIMPCHAAKECGYITFYPFWEIVLYWGRDGILLFIR